MSALSRLLALTTLLIGTHTGAQAWWNDAYTARVKLTLNTSATGVETKEAVTNLPVAVRLHSGNFDFIAAQPDGRDLRVVAGDDKTPLKFHVERFDSTGELGLLWVVMPTVAPGSDKNVVYVYYGNAKATAEPPAPGYDAATAVVLPFNQAAGTPPASLLGGVAASAPVALDANGLLAAAAKLDGGAPIELPAADKLKFAAGGAYTASLWIKPATAPATGTLLQHGPLTLALADGKLQVRLGTATVTAPEALPATWGHVAVVVAQGKLQLFVNGAATGEAAAALPELAGPVKLGAGFIGLLDDLQLAGTARNPEWLRLAASGQGAESKFVGSLRESADQAASEGESHNYFGILIKNLTTDAWVVIIILLVMLVIAAWVMVAKAMLVGRIDRDNRSFLQRFRDAGDDLLALDKGGPAHAQSSLYRLYGAGLRELRKRFDANGRPKSADGLSGASIDAIKASIDADLVRENHKLNSQMVLLTIAISGGPFLGLLGTVVGVMITFAAIAAAGDVNVNAIAPGIAAALLATVAGLGVAIPALFGYNYLAARIKNISADMQIFVDEFVTRVAELHGAK